MDLSKCREIVNASIKPIRDVLQLSHWHLDTQYLALESDLMQVRIKPEYRRATIAIDHDAFDTEEALLRSLRHELIHVVLAPFTSYALGVARMVKPKLQELDDWRFHQAMEETTANLELIFDDGVNYRPWEKEVVTE